MSNLVTIQTTTFVNHPNGAKSFGFRAYDNYGQCYNNTLEESDLNLSDFDLLKKILSDYLDETMSDMIDSIVENQKGLSINGNFYEFDEIKELLEVLS